LLVAWTIAGLIALAAAALTPRLVAGKVPRRSTTTAAGLRPVPH
jgi:hypothetical protein